MSEAKLVAISGCLVALVATSTIFAQKSAPLPRTKENQPSVRYEAEDGVPKDKAGEKRRDYAVLEAALNDLASPNNPEYEKRRAPLRVVINHKTSVADFFTSRIVEPDSATTRKIPADVQKDLDRRAKAPAMSLADFKPTSTKIIVDNLDDMLDKSPSIFGDGLKAVRKKYPSPSSYVWAHPPGYSADGNSAIVVFGFPMGMHGGDWVYMLSKKGKRWQVDWRHCQFYR